MVAISFLLCFRSKSGLHTKRDRQQFHYLGKLFNNIFYKNNFISRDVSFPEVQLFAFSMA